MQGMLTKKGRNLGFGLGFWRTTRLYMLTDTTLSYTDKTKKEVKVSAKRKKEAEWNGEMGGRSGSNDVGG
jgi:hypothetical protein